MRRAEITCYLWRRVIRMFEFAHSPADTVEQNINKVVYGQDVKSGNDYYAVY